MIDRYVIYEELGFYICILYEWQEFLGSNNCVYYIEGNGYMC